MWAVGRGWERGWKGGAGKDAEREGLGTSVRGRGREGS